MDTFDIFLFNVIHSLAQKSSLLDSFVIFFARYLAPFMTVGAIFFVFSFKNIREKIFVFIMLAMTAILSRGILTEVIRFTYDRERPFESFGFEPLFLDINPAFPSGHAAFLFALAMVIFYFNRFWGSWFLGFSLLVGLARVFSGLHWPSDIFGGVVVALISFLITERLLRKYRPEYNNYDD